MQLALSRSWFLPVFAGLLLGGCVSAPPAPVQTPEAPQVLPPPVSMRASFACSGALPEVHWQICTSDALASLDRQLAERVHQRVQELDLVGALLLEASQRQWQLSRAGQCGLGEQSASSGVADPTAQACLGRLYQARLQALDSWPSVSPRSNVEHPLAAYAEFRLAEGHDALCQPLANALNADLRRHGDPDVARLPGNRALISSAGGEQQINLAGVQLEVDRYNAGPFAGYQQRSRGLSINGVLQLDQRTLPRWVAAQPNYGGRANVSSSQTGDYARIDVFEREGRPLVLVNETWGFYSPAARGESAFAGLYALQGGSLQPLCLYQSYLTPPRTRLLEGLPIYSQLTEALDTLAGDPLPGYAQHERRDNFQRWKERQWTLLNLPLLGADALSRYGREAALRQRHDQALEMLFQWSERNLRSKQRYQQLLPLLRPAHAELHAMYQQQGLDAAQAGAAADLLLHETFARSLENLQAPAGVPGLPLQGFASYQPRYAIAPTPGELEHGRSFQRLHSVLLNQGPLPAVRDFLAWESRTFGEERGLGADADTALMAAANNPPALAYLLEQGLDPNQANAWGKTALMTAVQQDNAEAVSLLLAAGADVHAQTRARQAGVGGPDRQEAARGRQTALLMAAEQASETVITQLLAADAARQAWGGYDMAVCTALAGNAQLLASTQQALRARLCVEDDYAPLPVSRQVAANLREGDVLVIRDEGIEYPVSLLQRGETQLFGRHYQLTPKRLRSDLRGLATNVGIAANRRARLSISGPLTLVFDDLAAVSPESVPLQVSFPVSGSGAAVAGYALSTSPAMQVLSTPFDAERNDAESTWRALYSAALTQGFRPTGQGYVLIHTRGRSWTEYQLVVTE